MERHGRIFGVNGSSQNKEVKEAKNRQEK